MPEGIKHSKDIEASVCGDILNRQKMGIAKYGTSVSTNPLELHQWFKHAYEEALDLAIYLKRIMADLETVSLTPQSPEQIAEALSQVLKEVDKKFNQPK